MTRLVSAALIALFFSLYCLDTIRAEEAKKPTTIAVFELKGTLPDQAQPEDPLLGNIGTESLHSLLTRLKKAGTDETVAAAVLLLNDFSLSTPQVEELSQVIHEVKKSKPVYAHADAVSTRTYALMASASRVSLSPIGDVWINGLAMEGLYLRGLLDLLGVQPEFLTCGDYKSAAEMFMLKESSPASLEMKNWLLDSTYASTVSLIAKGRDVEPDQVKKWIDQGLYSAETAKAANLIDAVESREKLLEVLKKEHGVTIKLDRSFAKKKQGDIDLENPFAVMQLWAQLLGGSKPKKSTKNAIAIVHVNGPIMLGKPEQSLFGGSEGAYSESIRKALGTVADEPRIRAVVLRVNSPGGSATASEVMLQAIQNVQTSKPVVVSMGGVAASGGYYVAARGDRIFADATTITGSIGVVAGKLSTANMWNRIGINFDLLKRGERAGMMTSIQPWTEEEKGELQKWMNEIYGVFKNHVVEGRKDKLTKPIDEIAGGRVFTGQQALELGLVDEIGTLNDAIAYAAKQVELEDYEIRSFPEHQNFLEQLFADISDKKKDDKRLSTGIWSSILPALQSIDREHALMIHDAIRQLDHLQQERVMLTAPVLRVLDR
ncbi:MAG TPA: signal peptide peptidase SppA [Planctomicrobium sp.]|nr:signal peptide peptidase SppA [Planctomicrobium sp.]